MIDRNQPVLIGIILDVSNSMQKSWKQRGQKKLPRFDVIREVINEQFWKITSMPIAQQNPIEVFCLGMGFQKLVSFAKVNLDNNEEAIEVDEEPQMIPQSNLVCDLLALSEIVPTITELEALEKSLNDKWNAYAEKILSETQRGLDVDAYDQLTIFIENGLHESAYDRLHHSVKFRFYLWLSNSSIRQKWGGFEKLFRHLSEYTDKWKTKIESSCTVEAEKFFHRIQTQAKLFFEENKANYVQTINDKLHNFATTQIQIILELLTVGHTTERVLSYFDENRAFSIAKEIYSHLNREIEKEIRIPLLHNLGGFLKEMRFELRASLSKKELKRLTSQCIEKYAWEILEPFVQQTVFDLVQECFQLQARKMFLYWINIASSREVILPIQEIEGILPNVANENILRNQYMFGTTPISEALNSASMRLLDQKYRTHKKILIVVSDGEFEENKSTQSLHTPIHTSASLLKQSGVTIVSLYVTNKSVVKQFVSRISARWPDGAKTLFEIASEISEDKEFSKWFQKQDYSLLDKRKLLVQINEAKLLQEIFDGIFQNPENAVQRPT